MTNPKNAEELYQKMLEEMETEAIISNKRAEMQENHQKLTNHTQNLEKVSQKFRSLKEKVASEKQPLDNYKLIDALNIESLRDSCEEEHGKLSKVKLVDVIECNQLSFAEEEATAETEATARKAKILEIELLQAKIDFLLKGE